MDIKPLEQITPQCVLMFLCKTWQGSLFYQTKQALWHGCAKTKHKFLVQSVESCWSKPVVDRLFGMAIRGELFFVASGPCPLSNDTAPSASPWSLEPYTICKTRCSTAKDCVRPVKQLGASY